MRCIHIFLAILVVFLLAGCANLDCKPNSGAALPGTDKVLVGIYIDKKGYPQATIDTVRVYPGQKIIFAGPDRFDILFKDQKSIVDKLELQSSNGIIVIEVPRDIFEREQPQSTQRTNISDVLKYSYGIRANGNETDPEIIVTRR